MTRAHPKVKVIATLNAEEGAEFSLESVLDGAGLKNALWVAFNCCPELGVGEQFAINCAMQSQHIASGFGVADALRPMDRRSKGMRHTRGELSKRDYFAGGKARAAALCALRIIIDNDPPGMKSIIALWAMNDANAALLLQNEPRICGYTILREIIRGRA